MKFLFFLVMFWSVNVFGQSENRVRSFNLTESSLALKGFDPVSYFLGQPTKGSKVRTYQHKGVLYYFSSDKNRDAFRETPEKYEPQFGGWCAFAMGSTGEKVDVDPETFKIVNGKLYLFYNRFFNNTLVDWNKDERNLDAKAKMNWSKYYKQ